MPHTILQALRLVKRAVRPLPRARSGLIVFSLAAIVAGCASGPPAAVSNIRYDLGDPAPLSNTMPMPPVKVLAVSASKNLDTDAFIYRLKYADAQRIGRYSDSHWTMSPADLRTQRLRVALASRGPVLTGSDPVRAPMLQGDLTDFATGFDCPERS